MVVTATQKFPPHFANTPPVLCKSVIRVLNTPIPLHAFGISGPNRNDGDKFSDSLSLPYKYSLPIPPVNFDTGERCRLVTSDDGRVDVIDQVWDHRLDNFPLWCTFLRQVYVMRIHISLLRGIYCSSRAHSMQCSTIIKMSPRKKFRGQSDRRSLQPF